MAQFSELTAEQQARILELLRIVRPYAGELGRLNVSGRAADALWVGNVDAIVALLDAGAEVPNETGLDQASPLTKEEIQNSLMAWVQAIITTYDTAFVRGVLAKAAGAVNLARPTGT